MSETYQFALPLVEPAQAQKHVTVNEALARLDALAQMRVVDIANPVPPVAPLDGESYFLPAGASGDWSGHDGEIALWANGGWEFITPKSGWKIWSEAHDGWFVYDGEVLVTNATAITGNGAATQSDIIEIDHVLGAGASSSVVAAIPALAQVIGVTGRVTTAFTGTATNWRLGVAGSDNRYGSGLGLGLNSFVLGMSGAPVTYYSATDLLLTGEGGDFAAGEIRLAVHYVTLTPPRSV